MFISFLLCCAGKRKEMNQRKEKPALYKRDFKTQKRKFPSTHKISNSVRKIFIPSLKISNRIPSGLRPEPPTAHKVSRYCVLSHSEMALPRKRCERICGRMKSGKRSTK